MLRIEPRHDHTAGVVGARLDDEPDPAAARAVTLCQQVALQGNGKPQLCGCAVDKAVAQGDEPNSLYHEFHAADGRGLGKLGLLGDPKLIQASIACAG
jgi:hypothetical protein